MAYDPCFGSDPGRRPDGATLDEARWALAANRLDEAERLVRRHLRSAPDDPAAHILLAAIPAKLGRLAEAEELLRRTLALAPGHVEAESVLATILLWQDRVADALEILDRMLAKNPDDVEAALRKAVTLADIGRQDEALEVYAALMRRLPGHLGVHLAYGHLLNTVGRREESINAYRFVIGRDPSIGQAWWGLANLKTVRLEDAEIETMRAALCRPGLSEAARWHLHFALGKALEDMERFEDSFEHYSEGNRIRRAAFAPGWRPVDGEVGRTIAAQSRDFFAERAGQGCLAVDPIFILGMPRAGSTLIEQILASHPLVEGTSELTLMSSILQALEAEQGRPYPEAVSKLQAERLAAIGEDYLRRAAIYRTSGRPRFIDKMPANWRYIGLIHLILPNARIIDARRHPLDCCFANFRQHYARGHEFAYSLSDLGNHYRNYLWLLRHFDAVLPGRIHRVVHERLVADPETEIRRLLDHLDLPFDEACLKFHENRRAVRTPSAGQVRQPINRAGFGRWQPYRPWLGPLFDALGSAIDAYPDAPIEWK